MLDAQEVYQSQHRLITRIWSRLERDITWLRRIMIVARDRLKVRMEAVVEVAGLVVRMVVHRPQLRLLSVLPEVPLAVNQREIYLI